MTSGGDTRGDSSGAEDGSIFATATAPGVQVGVAIVTAVQFPESPQAYVNAHNSDPAHTAIVRRVVRGAPDEKRAILDKYRGANIDSGLTTWEASRKTRWKLSGSATVADWPRVGTSTSSTGILASNLCGIV